MENVPQEKHINDLIRVKNPTNKPFRFFWDGTPQDIGAGEEKDYPRWLAVHYAKKLIVAIINSKIQQIKVGERTVDSLRTNDPSIQAKLAPHILLYVSQRYIEPPRVDKKVTARSEFTIDQFEVSDKERHVKTQIDLPDLERGETEDIFGIPKEFEQGFDEKVAEPQEEVENAPQTTTEPSEATTEEFEVEGDLMPDVLEKKPKKKATLNELMLEARALNIPYNASESYEEIEKKILESANAG